MLEAYTDDRWIMGAMSLLHDLRQCNGFEKKVPTMNDLRVVPLFSRTRKNNR